MTAIQVVFRNDNLIVIDHNNTPYVPMRPIVEGMGLAWVAQFVKLKSNTRFSVTEIITQLPNDIQQRKVACMPLRKLPGWLSTIYPNKVKPELRDKIIAYQNECDDILWAAWQRQRPEQLQTGSYAERSALISNINDDKLLSAAIKYELTRPGRRYLMTLTRDPETGDLNPVFTSIPEEARLIRDQDLPEIIGDPNCFVSRQLLPEIISQAAKRLGAKR